MLLLISLLLLLGDIKAQARIGKGENSGRGTLQSSHFHMSCNAAARAPFHQLPQEPLKADVKD